MKPRIFVVASVVCICALIAVGQNKKKKPVPSPSPSPELSWSTLYEDIKWKKGPSLGELGDTGQVKVPDGYVLPAPAIRAGSWKQTKIQLRAGKSGLSLPMRELVCGV